MRAMARLAAAAVSCAAALVAAGPSAAPAVAKAAVEHRAAVLIDTGAEVKRVCVRFSEESITGIEALTRAAADPVVRAFPGKGAAVCSLCGTGCPGDESCLTCDGGGRFWSYSRAPAGTDGLRTSGVGASSTTVRDGDVEGWRWGRGATPPFASVAEVCGDVAPPSPAAPPASSPAPATTLAGPAVAAVATTRPVAAPVPTPVGRARTTTAPSAAPGPTAPEATVAPATAASSETVTTVASAGDLDAAAPAASGGDEGGGWGGLVAFGAALAGLGTWAVAARRRRRGDAG